MVLNGTKISTYGTKLLTLDLELKHKLQLLFIIGEVVKPFISSELFATFRFIGRF